jgi:hypothetical protein
MKPDSQVPPEARRSPTWQNVKNIIMNTPGVKCWVLTQFFVGQMACDLVKGSNQMVPIKYIERLAPGYCEFRVKLTREIVKLLHNEGHHVAVVLSTKYLRATRPSVFGGDGGFSTQIGTMWKPHKNCYKGCNTLHVRIVHPCALWTQSEKLGGGKGTNRVAALVREIQTYVATYSSIAASKKGVR